MQLLVAAECCGGYCPALCSRLPGLPVRHQTLHCNKAWKEQERLWDLLKKVLVLITRGAFWDADSTMTLPITHSLHSTVFVLGCQGKCPEQPFVSALWPHATVTDVFGSWDGASLVSEPAATWSLQLPNLTSWYSLSCTIPASNTPQVPSPDSLGSDSWAILLKRKLVKGS